MKKVTFNNQSNEFSLALRKKVNDYFVSRGIAPTGNWKLYLKTALLVSLAVSSYILLVFTSPAIWVSVLLCIMLGICLAGVGFNVMHDGAHGSYSQKQWVNDVMAYSLNLMGGSSHLWKIKHNTNHHIFTNIEGHDDDIDIKFWMRTNENQPRYWFHRYQYIYCVLLYGFTYLIWVFSKDFEKYFTRKVATVKIKKMSLKQHVIFWFSKLFYFSTFLVIPALKVGVAETLIGYTIVSFVTGFIIAVVFQLAHIVEGTDFPLPDQDSKKIEKEWAIHQLATTVNFATGNKIISWFVGGLNYQVEHHLFPYISHVHYPEINKLVRSTCMDYNIPYREYPTLVSAIGSHVRYLKTIGRQ